MLSYSRQKLDCYLVTFFDTVAEHCIHLESSVVFSVNEVKVTIEKGLIDKNHYLLIESSDSLLC